MTETAPTEKPRILMVDDSRVMRKAFNKILSDEYVMLEADDGESGWAMLSSDDSIRLVISDIEMPVLDGFGLLERIRSDGDARLQKIPLIFITGAEDEQTKERALAAGATDFVIKPVDKVQLLARVRSHVRLDQAHRDLANTTSALKEEATLDLQTGLTSRKYFQQRCEQDISSAMRYQEQMTLMRIDIDRYKKVYAQVGDDGFDDLLHWLAKILLETARTEDTVSRVGGAEFAILAPKTDHQGGPAFAQRLIQAVAAKPYTGNGANVPVTISVGVVIIGIDQEIELDSILKLAEERLELARSSGGNQMNAGSDAVAVSQPAANDPAPATEPMGVVEEFTRPIASNSSVNTAIYIDQALELLSRNETEELEPYMVDLLLHIMPLLEYGNSTLNLSLGFAMNAMRERLESLKADEVLANSQ